MNQQLDLFTFNTPKYVVNKPIKLIELFAGIGSQHKAFKILGANVENHKICEWAMNSIIGYYAIHNEVYKPSQLLPKEVVAEKLFELNVSLDYNLPATYEQLKRVDIEKLNLCYEAIQNTHNLVNVMKVKGADLEITDTDKYDYIMTYSFPCQDLSLAGKREGMSVSQSEGGTRSGLLWEVERILCELDYEHRPQILMMENVKEVIGTGAIEDFKKWRSKLETLGYSNHCEVLNGKNFGIPQNRVRAFMISIKGDYSYQFPYKMPLKYKLKDFLENEVDEKYYLTNDMIDKISNWKSYEKPIDNAIDVERERERIMPTITARGAGEQHAGMKLIKVSIPNNEMPIKNNTLKGYEVAQDGDGINICGRMEYQRGNVQKGMAQTINTKGTDGGVCVKKN